MKKVYVLMAGLGVLAVYRSKTQAEKMANSLNIPYFEIIETNLL
jgi:hypothetical protein